MSPESYFHFVFRSRKNAKQPVGKALIVLYGNNWMYGINQPLLLKEAYYRMSYFNFCWQILKWKEYKSSQLITLVWKVTICLPMTAEKLKAFLTIPLVSGYARLPRQEMYWEIREDCHNLVVSAMMKKTEFLQCKQYLHLADNNALNSSDKSAEVWPLFNAINE